MNSQSIKQRKKKSPSGLTASIKTATPRGLLMSTLIGLATAFTAGCALLFAASAIVYSTSDPARYVIPASLTVLYSSCFLGGAVCSVSYKKAPLVCGLTVPLLFLPLLFIGSLFLSPTLSAEHALPLSVGLRGIGVIFSILGALVGTQNKKTKHKKRKS